MRHREQADERPHGGPAGLVPFVASVLLFVSALVLNLRRPQFADLAFTTGELVAGLALLLFGWFGALVVSRQPSHPIGWVLCAFGVLAGVGGFASEYAIFGLRSHPGAVPGPRRWPGSRPGCSRWSSPC